MSYVQDLVIMQNNVETQYRKYTFIAINKITMALVLALLGDAEKKLKFKKREENEGEIWRIKFNRVKSWFWHRRRDRLIPG